MCPNLFSPASLKARLAQESVCLTFAFLLCCALARTQATLFERWVGVAVSIIKPSVHERQPTLAIFPSFAFSSLGILCRLHPQPTGSVLPSSRTNSAPHSTPHHHQLHHPHMHSSKMHRISSPWKSHGCIPMESLWSHCAFVPIFPLVPGLPFSLFCFANVHSSRHGVAITSSAKPSLIPPG